MQHYHHTRLEDTSAILTVGTEIRKGPILFIRRDPIYGAHLRKPHSFKARRPLLRKSCGECQCSGLRICPFSASAPQGGNMVAQDGSLVHTAVKVGDMVASDQLVVKAGNTVAQADNLVHTAATAGNTVAQAGTPVHTAAKVGNGAAPD